MKKKIGILTFHYGYNYGGVLQSYALQETIKRLGYDVKIINFSQRKWYWFFLGIPLKLSLDAITKLKIKLIYGKQCRSSFNNFRKQYLDCTEEVDERHLPQLADNFDVIIVGSDQVWNPSQHNKNIYFVNWNPEFKGKRVSYAPCCGYNNIDPRNKLLLSESLLKFDNLSVRNIETQEFVSNLIDRIVPIVPDPTLLYNFDEFIDDKENSPYILTYILGEDITGGNDNAIQYLKSIYPNLPVYAIIIADSNPMKCKWADKVFYNLSPGQWVNMIAKSSFFYTDSFHGVIFALKFKRPFIAYYSSTIRASRFVDLMTRYNLSNYIFTNVKDIKERWVSSTRMDLRGVLYEEIEKGMDFLKRSLQ